MPQILQPMASLRHFPALAKNSLCSDSFASTEKCSDGLFYGGLCLKNKNYILNCLKILDLEKFVINSLSKQGLVAGIILFFIKFLEEI